VIARCRNVFQRASALALVAATALVSGCDSAPAAPSGGVTYQVDSSGGVPVTMVSGAAPEWTLDSLAVIRADPEVGFSAVRSMALDPRGGIWVADTRENRVSRWGDDGNWIEDRGRVGSGPGEFRVPASIAVHQNGLYVHDVGNARVVRFDLVGSADTSWRVGGRVSGDAMTVRFYPNPDGPLIFDALRTATPPRTLFLGVDSRDSLFAPPRENRANDAKVCPIGDGIRFFSSPFAPYPRTAPIGTEVVESAGDGRYRLSWHDGAGTLGRVVERDAPRAPVTDAEYQTETADWRAFNDSLGSPPCDGEMVRYKEKPSVRALLPDADGRLWVEQERPDGVWYEVWAGDSLVAQVVAPERSLRVPPVMRGDRLAVAQELPDGGLEVRLFRINEPAP
jgi:hypothetical protein